MTLQVYGRTEYAEPLVGLGTVDDGADPQAVFTGSWLELVVFPEDAVHWIVRDGGMVDDA